MHHSLYRPPSMLQTNENICLESLEAREALQLGLNCKKRKQPCLTYSESHLKYSESHKFKYKVTFVTDTVKTIANQRHDVVWSFATRCATIWIPPNAPWD